MDHRGHGDSGSEGFDPPHTIEACVQDTLGCVNHLMKQGHISKPPVASVGHSFGGKVAVAWHEAMTNVKLTWVLDSPPGLVSKSSHDLQDRSQSVVCLLEELKTFQMPATRQMVVENLMALGFSSMVANWMTTNIQTNDEGQMQWAFDLDIAHSLLDDYMSKDLFPLLATDEHQRPIHFVRAERNRSSWTPEVLDRFARNTNKQKVFLHTMENVGHFIHAEDPMRLYKLMSGSFQSLV